MTAPGSRGSPDPGGGPSHDAVVVGGGIAGLTAAHELARSGHDVVLLEAGPEPGGKLARRSLAGAPIDVGADSMLARHGAGVSLSAALGLELAHPATGDVQLLVDGRPRRLPAGTVLGAPTDLLALARSRVLSPAGLARAALEAAWPGTSGLEGDRAAGDVVAERYGPEVVERLVEPLLGGIYAGRPDELSVLAATPIIARARRHGRSLAHGLRRELAERRPADGVPAPVFAAPVAGMASLATALADGIRSSRTGTLRSHVAADGIEAAEAGWAVRTAAGPVQARAVVVAVPAHVAGGLLADVAAMTATQLRRVRHASVGVVGLQFAGASVADLPAASGILVPRREGRLVKAATWLGRKWPHLADRGAVLRASVGRIDDRRWLELDDDELVAAVVEEVRQLTGIERPVEDAVVMRWMDALPQYEVGHLDLVDQARAGLPAGILLAGAALDGIGVSPCVASGTAAAQAVQAHLQPPSA